MRIFMELAGCGWVVTHRHRIFALALLQCLLTSSFSETISATRFHVDNSVELHRSMGRYRQLREFEHSERDPIEVAEETMGDEEGEVNLTTDFNQQEEDSLEENFGEEVDEFGIPIEEVSNTNPHLDLQKQRKLEEHPRYESEQLHGFQTPTEDSPKLGQPREGVLENDEQHVLNKVESSPVENSDETLEHEKQHRGLEERLEHEFKMGDQIEEGLSDATSNKSKELHQQYWKGLEMEHGAKTEEQQAVKESKEEPFIFPEPYLLGPTITDWDEQRGNWLEENLHMKSNPDKPRVLVVSGSHPEPCVSPVGDHFHMKSLKLKIDYARMHNYEIYYNFAWLDPLFGGWWVKLPTLRKLMLTHPEIEWFFWIDSDAVFTDMLFEAPFNTYKGSNMVMWGWEDGVLNKRSWVAFNAGVFLMRNCQWSLDLIDKWSPMGPKGPVRDEYGKLLTSFLSDRKDNFSSDDQSALAYLMITDETVRAKIKLVESDIYAMSGFWLDVVDTYEDCLEKYHPGLGDKRWPWITHFTGCGYCAGGDNPAYAYDKCLKTFDRAYNFADNQVMAFMGFQHESLASPNITRIRNETGRALEFVGVNPWEEKIALQAAAAEGTSS